MLTKDLIECSVVAGVVNPKWANAKDEKLMLVCEKLINFFSGALGQSIVDFEKNLADSGLVGCRLERGIKSILESRFEYRDVADISIERMNVLISASNLRSEISGCIAEFDAKIGQLHSKPISQIKENLYGDLLENRQIEKFNSITPIELIDEYNIQLVQGVISQSSVLYVELENFDTPHVRQLLKAVKFHSLLFKILEFEKSCKIEISGPTSLFKTDVHYDVSLACFFRALLTIRDWKISATVLLKGKKSSVFTLASRNLNIDFKKIKSSYIPPEILEFISAFNEKKNNWLLYEGEQISNWGNGRYSFADWEAKCEKRIVFIELFHKWHKNALHQRLQDLSLMKNPNYILGVDKKLLGADFLGDEIEKSALRDSQILIFSGLPTRRALLAQLDKLSS